MGDIRIIILELCNLAEGSEGLFFPSVLTVVADSGAQTNEPTASEAKEGGETQARREENEHHRQYGRGGSTRPGEGEPAPHAGVADGKVGVWRCVHGRHSEKSH